MDSTHWPISCKGWKHRIDLHFLTFKRDMRLLLSPITLIASQSSALVGLEFYPLLTLAERPFTSHRQGC